MRGPSGTLESHPAGVVSYEAEPETRNMNTSSEGMKRDMSYKLAIRLVPDHEPGKLVPAFVVHAPLNTTYPVNGIWDVKTYGGIGGGIAFGDNYITALVDIMNRDGDHELATIEGRTPFDADLVAGSVRSLFNIANDTSLELNVGADAIYVPGSLEGNKTHIGLYKGFFEILTDVGEKMQIGGRITVGGGFGLLEKDMTATVSVVSNLTF